LWLRRPLGNLSALNPFTAALILTALVAVGVYAWLRPPAGLFTGRRARLPRTLDLTEVPDDRVPIDARAPLEYLAQRLGGLGFRRLDGLARAPDFERTGHRLLIVAFVHEDEATYFFMGIESGVAPRSELMLHVITPLEGGRSVETTTLPTLDGIRPPPDVDVRCATDAGSIEELWSRHRRALTRYERRERAGVRDDGWSACARRAYGAWIDAAVRAQRLVLDAGRDRYRVRRRPRGVV